MTSNAVTTASGACGVKSSTAPWRTVSPRARHSTNAHPVFSKSARESSAPHSTQARLRSAATARAASAVIGVLYQICRPELQLGSGEGARVGLGLSRAGGGAARSAGASTRDTQRVRTRRCEILARGQSGFGAGGAGQGIVGAERGGGQAGAIR